MKKSKKEKPRPRFVCERCGMLWVSCEQVCVICGITGKPLNEGATKILNKCGEQAVGASPHPTRG